MVVLFSQKLEFDATFKNYLGEKLICMGRGGGGGGGYILLD